MASLAARLGVVTGKDVAGETRWTELFDTLRRREAAERWLLIFDNANEPDEIRDLIPPVSGHVLITSRNSRWEATGDLMELDVFERGESIEFQRRRTRKFNVTDAHRLAGAVGDLPILLEHAAESQTGVDQYIAHLEKDPLGLLDGQPSDYQGTIADEWQTVLDQLEERSPDSLGLLACLCFFNDEPIPQGSLERGSHLPDVSIHDVLRDPLRRNLAVMMLRRAGLLRVRAQAGTLEVHQATRYIMRAIASREGADRAERWRHDVHLLLAAADPLDPEDPANWRAYDELRGHAAQAQAIACHNDSVWRLVVNMARYLSAIGDPRAALSLSDEALHQWTADTVNSSRGVADACLMMRRARAAALLAVGQAEDAFQLQQETLVAMRSDFRRWGMEMVLLDRLTGAHSRMTGDFRGAQVADQASANAHEMEFGRDHPHVIPALNSVITNLVLNGEYADAARTAQQVYRDALAFHNDDRYPSVLFQRNVVGRCLWLAGRYAEADSVLAEVHAGYGAAARTEAIDENHPWHLTHEADYAIARRDKGLKHADILTLVNHLHDVRRRCWRKLGANHPQTLAVTVILGGILGKVSGREGDAMRLLEDAQRRYQSALPGHPYGHACTGLVAAVRCRTVNGGPERAESARVIQGAIERLTDSVGADHPLTLTAASALVNALARAGELDAARERGEEVVTGLRARFGAGHPHTLASEANIAIIQSRMGRDQASAELRARLAATVGPGHPVLASFTHGHLIDIDFTPLPL
jgi:hypothetical protein